jgi:serine/threonine-protein kinase
VAPELAGGTQQLSPAVDVFAFGVLAYGLLTGKSPFAEPPFLARLDGRDVPRPAPVEAQGSAIRPDLATALDACLSLTGEGRPGVDELIALIEADLTASDPRQEIRSRHAFPSTSASAPATASSGSPGVRREP